MNRVQGVIKSKGRVLIITIKRHYQDHCRLPGPHPDLARLDYQPFGKGSDLVQRVQAAWQEH